MLLSPLSHADEVNQQRRAVAQQPGQRKACIHQLCAGERHARHVVDPSIPHGILVAGDAEVVHAVRCLPVKPAQAQADGRGIGAHARLHKAQQRLAAIRRGILPRIFPLNIGLICYQLT